MTLSTIKAIQQNVQRGQFQAAFTACKDYLKDFPNDIEVLYLAAVSARYLKHYDDALDYLQLLTRISPHYGRAYQEFGHVFTAKNDGKAAASHYFNAVKYNPSLHASWQGVYQHSNNTEYKQTAQRNLSYLQSLPKALVSVTSFIYEDKLDRAEKLCRHFLMSQPKHVEGMRLLAKIADKHHVLDDAEFLLEACHALAPENYWVQFDYINVLHRRQKFESAYDKAVKLAALMPDDSTTLSTLANQQAAIGKYAEAISNYQMLIRKDVKNAVIPLLLGHVYKTIGEQQNAINAYSEALQREPLLCDAYWSLANLKTYVFDDTTITKMQKLTQHHGVTGDAAVQLNFALGKAYEDRKDYQQSFTHYQHGNQLKRNMIGYQHEVMSHNFELQKALFTREIAEQFMAYGHTANDPIFILGLPRTGSTLVEQILSSHSQIDGTLELPNILAYVQELNGRKYKDKAGQYPGILSELSASDFSDFGQRYLDETQVHRQSAPFFIDKMPNNFRHIGLIKSILPNAKIIDTRRQDMSCCFSVFKQLFAEGQEFSYSFEDIVAYYQGYLSLMDHWHQVYPGDIMTVQYETLVSKPQQTIQSLFDYLALDAEPSCFEFHKTKRAVRTASSEQVRQPINKKGTEQWKHYEPYLTELAGYLDP